MEVLTDTMMPAWAGQPCGQPRPAPTLPHRRPGKESGATREHEMTDLVTQARAALLRPVLQHCAEYLPAEALAELREDIAAIGAKAAKGRSAQQRAILEACAMALADLDG